jgi:hypothetical protein
MHATTAALQHALAPAQTLVAIALPDGPDGYTHSLYHGQVQYSTAQYSMVPDRIAAHAGNSVGSMLGCV